MDFGPQCVGAAVEGMGFGTDASGLRVAFESDELGGREAHPGYAHTAVPGLQNFSIEFVARFLGTGFAARLLKIGQ